MGNPSPLAPGFRFHPTDEELVLFYLKRKLLSRPFPINAIPEIDLYRSEPWELPGKSSICGGDQEWYFFCRLYRNNSRASRATARGYWKTTGKDRAVRNGAGRVAGTKKTLVFHVGRAPKGERTNWVMHEYRIAADEIGLAGIDPDAYVVCRIFQKGRPDPQKGAQYGVLVEEEGKDYARILMLRADPSEEQVMLLENSEQRLSLKIPCKNASSSQEFDDKEVGLGPIYPTNLYGDATDTPLPNNTTFGETNSFVESQIAPGTSAGDYLEVDDLAAPLDEVHSAEGPVSVTCGLCIDSSRQCDDDTSHFSSLTRHHDVDVFFDASDDTFIDDEEFVKDILSTGTDEYFCGEQAAEDAFYFDAPMPHPNATQDHIVEMSDFMDAIVTGRSLPDPMEELVAYFGATEDRVDAPYSEYLESEEIATASALGHFNEVDDSKPLCKSSSYIDDAKDELGSSSSRVHPSNVQERDRLVAKDSPYNKCKDKSLEGHLVNMLGSISCPPALAAEMSKTFQPGSASQASTSIHVTAGIIHVDNYFVDESRTHWSTRKTQDTCIILSYALPLPNGHDDLVLASAYKMDEGMVLRMGSSGFGLACFSVVFLALIFKLGLLMYSR